MAGAATHWIDRVRAVVDAFDAVELRQSDQALKY